MKGQKRQNAVPVIIVIGLVIMWIMIFALITSTSSCKSNSSKPDTAFIVGTPVFVSSINKALYTLKQAKWLDFVEASITSIREVPRHSNVDQRTGVISISSDYVKASTIKWLASVLVHEAQHVRRPDLRNQAAELDANRFQIVALKAMNAPQWQIDWLKEQDGMHFDTNGNGVLDPDDDWSHRVK